MHTTDHRLVLLRRLAMLCAAMVLAVTTLSAYIRLSKAGLGCAEWPQCYGQTLRQLQQGVAPGADEQAATAGARLAHRAVAVIALLLAISMVMVCFVTRPALRVEGAMAVALLALAVFLAVLGRWSSGARVPAVAIGNLLGGFAMLALCARLAAAGPQGSAPAWARVGAAGCALLLLTQLALGGLVSSSYAGLSCSAWSECATAARGIAWETLNPWREPVLLAVSPVNPAGALPQVLHRALALALPLALAPLAVVAWRRGRGRRAVLLVAILAGQLGVGLAMVDAALPLPLALLHNGLASVLLATLVLLI